MTRYIGLAGLGFLGKGISICLQEHGFHVIGLDPTAKLANSENFTLAGGAEDFRECELVVESITEDFAAKASLYDEIEKHVDASVPICSNTSSIPISLLQAKRKHPNRFAGMHWSPPAQTTPFMEIIRGDQTDDVTVQKIVAISQDLDKEPGIVQKDIPGFVANRLAYAIYREAIHLLEEGVADLETIDLLCKNSLGLWAPVCGPFRWIDTTGGPGIYAKAMERIMPTLSNETEVSKTMRERRENNERFYPHNEEIAEEWKARFQAQAIRLANQSRSQKR